MLLDIDCWTSMTLPCSPSCSPSFPSSSSLSLSNPAHCGSYNIRYGLQTGVIPNNQEYGLNLTETLLPEFLSRQGYATHALGKWYGALTLLAWGRCVQASWAVLGCRHLGLYRWDMTPTFRGYDSFYGYYSGSQVSGPMAAVHRGHCHLGRVQSPFRVFPYGISRKLGLRPPRLSLLRVPVSQCLSLARLLGLLYPQGQRL